jgi:hypothetical protein
MISPARVLQVVAIATSIGFAQERSEPMAPARVPELLATLRSDAVAENTRLQALGDVATLFWRSDADAATRKQILAGILGLLTENSPESLTIGALRVLQALGLPRTLKVLAVECDATDRDVEVRLAALEAAAHVGGVAAVPTLAYSLGDDDPAVVDEAARWLDRVCWAQGDEPDPKARWRRFLHSESGEKLLVAALAKLRGAVGNIAAGLRNGIPTHVVALVLDDDLGDAAWQQAYWYLADCVGLTADLRADRRRATAAVREAWPLARASKGGAVAHRHGAAQLVRMMADRPAMSLYVEQGDQLWTWAVRHFDGAELGFPVYWRSAPPADGFDADHLVPTGATVASVRVRPIVGDSPPSSFERYWRDLAYELNNLRNAADYLALHKAALNGHLDKREWVRQTTMLEFKAVEGLRHFHEEIWRPYAARNGLLTTPGLWFVGAGETYEAWIASYSRYDGYPDVPFGRYYDETIAPSLAARDKSVGAGSAEAPDERLARLLGVLGSEVAPSEARLRALDQVSSSLSGPDVEGTKIQVVRVLIAVLGREPRAMGATRGHALLKAGAYVKLVAVAAEPGRFALPAEMRVAVVQAIADGGGVAAIPTLIQVLRDRDAAVVDASGRSLERICWVQAGELEQPERWQRFFCTEDGEKMLVAAFAKLRGEIGGAAGSAGNGLLAHVVAFVLDEHVGQVAWLEAYRYLTECAGERFVMAPERDRKGATVAVQKWWSSR